MLWHHLFALLLGPGTQVSSGKKGPTWRTCNLGLYNGLYHGVLLGTLSIRDYQRDKKGMVGVIMSDYRKITGDYTES